MQAISTWKLKCKSKWWVSTYLICKSQFHVSYLLGNKKLLIEMCVINWLSDDLLSEIYLKQQKNSQQNPPSHESASCGQECSDHQRWGFPDGSHIGERLLNIPLTIPFVSDIDTMTPIRNHWSKKFNLPQELLIFLHGEWSVQRSPGNAYLDERFIYIYNSTYSYALNHETYLLHATHVRLKKDRKRKETHAHTYYYIYYWYNMHTKTHRKLAAITCGRQNMHHCNKNSIVVTPSL